MPNTNINLHQIQSLMAKVIMHPTAKDDQDKSINTLQEYAEQIIKPNDELSSFKRIEIYQKQYWCRLIESLQDDFPGLNAIMGDEPFENLIIAYLTHYPSRSYTLSHLGSNLAKFILEEPTLTAPNTQLAHEISSLEWAEMLAFDAATKLPLKIKSLHNIDPTSIKLEIQPYITLLKLGWALDDFLLSLDKEQNKSVESNTCINRTKRFEQKLKPKKQNIFLAVHRLDNSVYYKQLDKYEFLLLSSLIEGKTLGEACEALIAQFKNDQDLVSKINQSFMSWMELGWFCDQSKQLEAI